MTEPRRILVRGATVLTMDADLGELSPGDVLIEGTEIRAVGTDLEMDGPVEIIDARGCIVVPGFVDTHRHMWEGIVRGAAPHHTFGQYMDQVLGEIGPALSPREIHLGTSLSARAALAAGVTTVQDISNIQDSPAHTDAVVSALTESGIRAVFAYGNSFPRMLRARGALPEDVRRVRTDLLPGRDGLVTMALVTEDADDEAERHNAALARELAVPVSRHSSPQLSVRRLRDLGALTPGTTLIHGNGLAAADLELLTDAGAGLSVSPSIEMVMGHGFPMITASLDHPGLPVGLSVDVEVTVAADLFTQMRAAYEAGRHGDHAAGREPRLTTRDVLRFATMSGARVLGLADRIGSLTPGKQADLVILRADRPDVAPVYDPASTVVLQMDRSHVDTVLVAGHLVHRDGAPVTDPLPLLEESAAVARRLVDAGVIKIQPGEVPSPRVAAG